MTDVGRRCPPWLSVNRWQRTLGAARASRRHTVTVSYHRSCTPSKEVISSLTTYLPLLSPTDTASPLTGLAYLLIQPSSKKKSADKYIMYNRGREGGRRPLCYKGHVMLRYTQCFKTKVSSALVPGLLAVQFNEIAWMITKVGLTWKHVQSALAYSGSLSVMITTSHCSGSVELLMWVLNNQSASVTILQFLSCGILNVGT